MLTRNCMNRLIAAPLDYKTVPLLYLLMPILFRLRGIPLNYEWMSFFIPYWVGISLYSVFFAVLFYLIEYDFRGTLKSLFGPFTAKKPRLLFLLAFFAELIWFFGFFKALIILSDLFAAAFLLIRLRNRSKTWLKDALTVLVPAFYFAAGFVLIASYNVLIGSIRYFGSYDPIFNSIDKILMFGWSVPVLSQYVAGHASPSAFLILEKIYFFMFPQIGACIILLTVQMGVKHAMRFVGAITIAYQLATLIYFCFPSLGPFFLTNPLSAGLPPSLITTHIQAELVQKLQSLWQTGTKNSIGLDFYIAFPCMHIAQPLIVLWFLRSMKVVVRFLLVYDFLMIFSIVLLQWHYLIDLIGGALVAIIVVKIHQLQSMEASGAIHEKDPTPAIA
jgi:hypothetical protein